MRPVPGRVGVGVEPEVGGEVDDPRAVVEQAAHDVGRLPVRRADEGHVDAADLGRRS